MKQGEVIKEIFRGSIIYLACMQLVCQKVGASCAIANACLQSRLLSTCYAFDIVVSLGPNSFVTGTLYYHVVKIKSSP